MIGRIKSKIRNSADLGKILANSGWLFADKLLRLGVGVLVSAWVARYLGPDDFGLWNYAIAFVTLIATVSGMGLNELMVRELIQFPEKKATLMGTAFYLKASASVLVIVISLVIGYQTKPSDPLFLKIVLLTSFSSFFQAFDVIEFYFQSNLKSKFVVIARNTSFLISSILKVLFILGHRPLIFLVWTNLIEAAVAVIFLAFFYARSREKIFHWSWDSKLAKRLLSQSWPLILSTLVVTVYMRIDQIMLGELLGVSAVGEFSAAVRLSEFWYFVPLAISASFFPSIINLRTADPVFYISRLQKLFDLLTLMSIGIASLTTFFAPLIIHLLYGGKYEAASSILSIHIWSGVFVFLGIGGSQWFIIENLQKFNFYRALLGAITNIALNFVLIPRYGPLGSAIATLSAQGIASYASNGISAKTLPLFKMQTMAFWNAVTLKPILSLK